MPTGGWAWRSAIQAPHYQTDRDVGAASIGEGLLAAYGVTRDARYLAAAKAAGDFLLGIAEPDSGGLRWPDWADPNGQRSATHYTSFDDGAAGISDYLLQLSTVTGELRFRTAALAGMRWLVAQAVGPSCPQTECSWQWTDDPSDGTAYNGVGMGQAGIVLALDTFADATGDSTFRDYARAGAARLRALTRDGRRPLPQGSEHPGVFETGFLNGSAGAAFMFLERYAHDHAQVDLETARRLLGWVNGQAESDSRGGLRWPLAVGDAAVASGFELGAAGIAWVNLQAARRPATGRTARSRVARASGSATSPSPGLRGASCRATSRLRFTSGSTAALRGSDGCWRISPTPGSTPPRTGRLRGPPWPDLQSGAAHDSLGTFWYENRTGGKPALPAEPSWHWGSAGIAAFAARLAGWSGRGPGGQRTG